MRRTLVLLVLGLATACQSEPAIRETAEPSASPIPEFVTVTGFLSTPYLSSPGDCNLRNADFIVQGLSEDQIKLVRTRTIVVRGSDGQDLGHATTASNENRIATGDRQSDYEICIAAAKWSIQLPSAAAPYLFSVEEAPGAPEPVSLDELQARDLRCNLHLDTDGRVLESDPCSGGGWVDTYG